MKFSGWKERKAREFFNQEVLPIISEQTQNFTDDEAFAIFSMFISMDKDKGGSLTCDEFYKLVGIKHSLIIERLWLFLTSGYSNQQGGVNLGDFFRLVSRLLSMGCKDFACFTFNIFDVDERNSLSIYEVDAMLRMIASKKEADHSFLEHVRFYCGCDKNYITLVQFLNAVESKPLIVQPIMVVQEKIKSQLKLKFRN